MRPLDGPVLTQVLRKWTIDGRWIQGRFNFVQSGHVGLVSGSAFDFGNIYETAIRKIRTDSAGKNTVSKADKALNDRIVLPIALGK